MITLFAGFYLLNKLEDIEDRWWGIPAVFVAVLVCIAEMTTEIVCLLVLL